LKLYKFRSLKNIEFTLDIILNEKLYCSPREELNDPFEGLFQFIFCPYGGFSSGFSPAFDSQTKDNKIVENDLKICSLSSSMKDVRMWSFYADDHKGIAIEIELDESEKLFPVDYLKKLPESPTANPDPFEILTKKTKHWCYESEYRIIQPETYYLIKRKIKKIYIGKKISDIQLELLKKVVPYEIPIHTTELDPHNIKIVPGDLVKR
jgi:hypothetical protein